MKAARRWASVSAGFIIAVRYTQPGPDAGRLETFAASYAELERLSLSGAGAIAGTDGLSLPDSAMVDRMTGPLLKEIDRVAREMDERSGPCPRDPR